jgi:hypothetical protein
LLQTTGYSIRKFSLLAAHNFCKAVELSPLAADFVMCDVKLVIGIKLLLYMLFEIINYVCDFVEEMCSTYTAAVFRVNMLKDNIKMDIDEMDPMIVRI